MPDLSIEPTRTITGKSTIPAGTLGNGQVTAMAVNNAMLMWTGAVIADFSKFVQNSYRNVWIYCAGEHKVAKVKSIMKVSATVYVIYCDRALPFVFNNQFYVVIGDLITYSVKNNGSADGEVDGAVLKATDAINMPLLHVPGNGYPKEHDVVTVNATGTSFVIQETR